MPAPTLTPTEALADYQITVSRRDLDDAAHQIEAITTYTLAEHVDLRGVYVGNVRRAWAIVASRVKAETEGDLDRAVDSESERDYSYSLNADRRAAGDLSLLGGRPNELLRIGARWDSFNRHETVADGIALVDGVRVPRFVDDNGVTFP